VPRAIMLGEPRLTQSEQVHWASSGASTLLSRLVSSDLVCYSRSPDGPVLRFTLGECQAFRNGLRFSGFDSFGSTASTVRAGLASNVACCRDDPQDHIETAPHLPSCTQAGEPADKFPIGKNRQMFSPRHIKSGDA
jgi:hypothetical protein